MPARELPDGPLAVSVEEAAALLGVSRTFVFDKLLRTGVLRSARLGGRRVIRVCDLESYLDSVVQ